MKLENYKDWNEVLSEDEFRHLIREMAAKKYLYSKFTLLEILYSLSEKYLLFYGMVKLTNREKDDINSTLIELTNFSDLSIIEELIGIMFNFRLNSYYSYLKTKIHYIELDEVKNEVMNSLKEYEEGEIENCF